MSDSAEEPGQLTKSLYQCSPRETRNFVERVIRKGLVPNIISSPGIGKSSIVKSIAKKWRLKVIDQRLSTTAPEDLSGLPLITEHGAKFVPFEHNFPITSTKIPDNYDGWLLFFDEFNSGDRDVQAAAYKILLDRMVGLETLHPNVAIACAGNLKTDRAIVNDLSTAMQSRLVHFEMVENFDEWMDDVALPNQYDSRIIAYLSMFPKHLMDFRPDHQDKTFCCPRTWEFMNFLCKDEEIALEDMKLFAGTITSGVAATFVKFCQVYKDLVQVKTILQGPSICPIPTDRQIRWATICHMMEFATEKNFADLSEYANRFELTERVLFYRGALHRNPKLRQHPSFAPAMSLISKYLNNH